MTQFNKVLFQNRFSLEIIYITFLISSALFALSIFMCGFFPIKVINEGFASREDIPTKLLNQSLDTEALYYRRTGRLVFILIDAFRWDFLNIPDHMPYVTELRKSKIATLFTARCHPPTATMPRVKALMTGSIPNYVDVILNLGSQRMKEDSLIHQAVDNGLKVVFYGDELWLHLFPEKFIRKEGTTSFFVSDYTEVDKNVTRNIASEMVKNDWNILILHYLGLDHIGHLAGPRSPLVPSKLKEMDEVIKYVHKSLQQWDLKHPQDPSYMVIAGDHGMHDLGSHGGATLGEILTSLILVENVSPTNPNQESQEVSQIDVTATLAVLLGLPIPRLSLGALIPHALKRLTDEQYLFALLYNTQQVANQFLLADPLGSTKDCFKKFLEAQEMHSSWLKSKSDVLKRLVESMYFEATQEMSSYLVRTLITFDMWALASGCLILLQVVLSLLCTGINGNDFFPVKTRKNILVTFICGLPCILLTSYFCSYIFTNAYYYGIKTVSLFIIVLHGWYFCVVLSSWKTMKTRSISGMLIFLCVGNVLHTASLSASSLIEEEHQTWYFMWITLLLLILFSFRFVSNENSHLLFQIIPVILSHRILRKLNQTGDKWAHVPDIADWLEMPEHEVILFCLFVSGLVGVWFSLRALKCFANATDNAIQSLALVCIFVYRMTAGDIFSFESGPPRGVQVAQLFWLLLGIHSIQSLRRIHYGCTLKDVVKIILSIWTLSSALLLRPCNIVLIPYLIYTSCFIRSIFKHPVECSLAHLWLGNVVFFYQGNSNSLSTVDVAAGYIGSENVNMLIAGFLVATHTFCFPILALLLLWLSSTSQPPSLRKRYIMTNLYVCSVHRLLPLSVYCIIITLQRVHLFIWSVFAPKLLYEVVHSVILLLPVVLTCILFLLCRH